MRLLRFLTSWWKGNPEHHHVTGEEVLSPGTTQAKARVHRRMLPVVRYLEKVHNQNPDLKFRYVGPNQMNGDAEELQVSFSGRDQVRGLTIRYLDSLQLYFIDGPHNQKLHQTTAGEVLASLSTILTEVFPDEELWNSPSARDRNYQS